MNRDPMTPSEPERKIRVLLVDDMKSLLIIMERGLRSQGHEVAVAESGSEAIEIFKENVIDVIVCDMAMEGMDGCAVSRAVRKICQERGIRKTPFILLTGWGEFDRTEAFEEAGVDLVVEKPADMKHLFNVIRSMATPKSNPARDC
ncbi:MAG: response regulator [Desulfomonile sp.]|nr:response regulator [Desulfomonile sp.]